jgi:tetraacyldisaccharide 4'-kinase
VLSDCNNLYTEDFFLPTGDLRDERKRILDASVVVITKCKENLSIEEANIIKKKLNLPKTIPLYFSCIKYTTPIHITTKQLFTLKENIDVLLVTGIANPKPMEKMLEEKVAIYEKLTFKDHHIFTIDDIHQIAKQFKKLQGKEKIILTTQKDAMRLLKFGAIVAALPVFILPIEMEFLFNQETAFLQLVVQHIEQFNSSS